MNHGEKMRDLRGERTKQAVANAVGVSLSSYVKYERNERTPKPKVMAKIAEYFGVSVESIFFHFTPSEHK